MSGLVATLLRKTTVALVSVASAAYVIAACSVSEDEVIQAEIDIADRPIEVQVTALRLSEDYEDNEVAANQKYDGKVLEIIGMVSGTGGGEDSAYYINLSTGDFSLTDVRCYFSKERIDEVTSVIKGDRVKLRGLGDEKEDRDPFTIDVIGCSLIRE